MEQKSSLIIQVLSVLGGLLAAGFFIGLLILMDVTKSTTSCSIVSILLITTAILISRYISKLFIDAINITFYIAGCLIPFLSIPHPDQFLIPLIGVSTLVFIFSRGFLLPFIAILSFNLSLFAKISEAFSFHNPFQIAAIPIIIAFLLLNLFENRLLISFPDKYQKYKSVHAGLFVSSLVVLGGLSAFNSEDWIFSPLVYLCGSLLLILLCFHYTYKKEFAASILLFIFTVSKFYYDLNLTLLTKSMLLFFTGIVFIIAWYLFTQKGKRHEKI